MSRCSHSNRGKKNTSFFSAECVPEIAKHFSKYLKASMSPKTLIFLSVSSEIFLE